MPSYNLSPVETRVLGCLMEKERTTPENYPLSLNSLTSACNQSTNRDPVVGYDEKTVEAGVNALREKKLAVVVFGAGSRVQKYRHTLLEHFDFSAKDMALLCVLMLRGPQTLGELRSRTERMQPFESLEEVEATLDELGRGDDPLVRLSPARPGQKERRYVQLFSTEVEHAESASPDVVGGIGSSMPITTAVTEVRVEALEAELAKVKEELQQLREELTAFRRQFE